MLEERFTEDNEVSEFVANGPNQYFFTTKGEKRRVDIGTESDEQYLKSIDDMLKKYDLGTRGEFINEGRIKLDNGEQGRMHMLLPPVCEYPQITIARKTQGLSTLDSLYSREMFNADILGFLKMAIKSKMTIVLSGLSGAGKTTFLEALAKEFSEYERVGVCEDAPEINLTQPNATYLHSTVWKPGEDRNRAVPLSWCIQQINRQRVDRIIVGEVRGKEFYDFIVAANSGIEGALTTVHGNNPKAALKKMANFIVEASGLSVHQANDNISQTVDIVIQIGFPHVGSLERRVISIDEVTQQVGTGTGDTIVINNLFSYDNSTRKWVKGRPTDHLRKRFNEKGWDFDTQKLVNSGSLERLNDTSILAPLKRRGE